MMYGPSWEADNAKFFKKFSAFCGIKVIYFLFRMFLCWILSWARWIQSSLLHISFYIFQINYWFHGDEPFFPSWEDNTCLATEEIHSIIWNSKVYYRVHSSLPLVPILSQLNPVHIHTLSILRSILMLSSHRCQGLPSSLFPSDFPIKTLMQVFIPFVLHSPSI
jgi:hypothetical protein